MADRISRSTAGRGASHVSGALGAVPANIVGPLRRFWDFTRKTAKNFAKQFNSPEEKETEFINIVRRDADRWT